MKGRSPNSRGERIHPSGFHWGEKVRSLGEVASLLLWEYIPELVQLPTLHSPSGTGAKKILDFLRRRDYLWNASGGNSSEVERHLAKVDVAGSNPVSRSIFLRRHSQEAKAEVCKTSIPRFESGCRLHLWRLWLPSPSLCLFRTMDSSVWVQDDP